MSYKCTGELVDEIRALEKKNAELKADFAHLEKVHESDAIDMRKMMQENKQLQTALKVKELEANELMEVYKLNQLL